MALPAEKRRSVLVEAAREFHADVLRRDRAVVNELATRYVGTMRHMEPQIADVAARLAKAAAAGAPPTVGTLYRMDRYAELQAQLVRRAVDYDQWVVAHTEAKRQAMGALGVTHAKNYAERAGVLARFGRLPVLATEQMAAHAARGPLQELLTRAYGDAAHAMGTRLVAGVALGEHPERVAKQASAALGIHLDRATLIARTEQLRSYRDSQLTTMRELGITQYKRVCTYDARTCIGCMCEDGQVYPTESFDAHPRCRCTMVPIIEGVPAPTWDSSEHWFREQDPYVQNRIMGPNRLRWWQEGKVRWDQLSDRRWSDQWGGAVVPKRVRDLADEAGLPWPPKPAPKPPTRPKPKPPAPEPVAPTPPKPTAPAPDPIAEELDRLRKASDDYLHAVAPDTEEVIGKAMEWLQRDVKVADRFAEYAHRHAERLAMEEQVAPALAGGANTPRAIEAIHLLDDARTAERVALTALRQSVKAAENYANRVPYAEATVRLDACSTPAEFRAFADDVLRMKTTAPHRGVLRDLDLPPERMRRVLRTVLDEQERRPVQLHTLGETQGTTAAATGGYGQLRLSWKFFTERVQAPQLKSRVPVDVDGMVPNFARCFYERVTFSFGEDVMETVRAACGHDIGQAVRMLRKRVKEHPATGLRQDWQRSFLRDAKKQWVDGLEEVKRAQALAREDLRLGRTYQRPYSAEDWLAAYDEIPGVASREADGQVWGIVTHEMGHNRYFEMPMQKQLAYTQRYNSEKAAGTLRSPSGYAEEGPSGGRYPAAWEHFAESYEMYRAWELTGDQRYLDLLPDWTIEFMRTEVLPS